MIEIIAEVGKFISNPSFITSILILGYLGCDRDKFARVTIAVLFSTIIASLLKSIFEFPLPPGNHEGWSFPSGHSISSVVFWFSIAIEYRSKIFAFLGVIACALVIFALLYYNYHYPKDIAAGVVIGALWLGLFQIIIKKWPNKKEYEIAIFLGMLGMIANFLNDTPDPWRYNLWRADAILFGLGLGWGIVSTNKINISNDKIFKSIRAVIGLLGFLLIYFVFEHLNIDTLDNTTSFFEFFLLSLWISFFTDQISKPLNNMLANERKKIP